jgi:hypothetical protein
MGGDLVEISCRSVDAEAVSVQSRIDATSRFDAPRRIVDERWHPFDEVPVPAKRKATKNVEVAADERLAVEHDGEEVHREVAPGEAAVTRRTRSRLLIQRERAGHLASVWPLSSPNSKLTLTTLTPHTSRSQ